MFCTAWSLSAKSVFAQTSEPDDSPEIQTVLFKITKSDSQYVSWIFGTHHAFGKSFFDSLAIAEHALVSSEIFIQENINIRGRRIFDIINSRVVTTKWSKYMSKKDEAYARNLLSRSQIDFDKITPTELSAFLNRIYKNENCKSKEKDDPALSLDDYMGSLAAANELKIIGLESTEEQLEIINKDVEDMPVKMHKKRLKTLIKNIVSGNTNDCGEIGKYAEMKYDLQRDHPCTNTLVLTYRNNKWMDQIAGYLDSNNCFIAVGLSHLMFECGLLNQLEIMGYTITPVPLK